MFHRDLHAVVISGSGGHGGGGGCSGSNGKLREWAGYVDDRGVVISTATALDRSGREGDAGNIGGDGSGGDGPGGISDSGAKGGLLRGVYFDPVDLVSPGNSALPVPSLLSSSPLGSSGVSPEPLERDATKLRKRLAHARALLEATAARAPVLSCFGMHEWAMLYAPHAAEPAAGPMAATMDSAVPFSSVRSSPSSTGKLSRHQGLPLRVSQAELNAAVERAPMRYACKQQVACVLSLGH